MMIRHAAISDREVRLLIRKAEITLAGNKKLGIYGTLHCKSGKRMNRENRVFFANEEEAKANGFRPCGNCKKSLYQQWIYSVKGN